MRLHAQTQPGPTILPNLAPRFCPSWWGVWGVGFEFTINWLRPRKDEETMKRYRKKGTTPMEPWTPTSDMEGVSIGANDQLTGSPMPGDMLAHNPTDPTDRWLVARAFFEENYEPVDPTPPHGSYRE